MSEDLLISETTDAEVRAVIGPRGDFYLTKWRHSKGGGFNRAAFFLSGLWLLYRKMYRIAAILGAVILLESLSEEMVFVWWLDWSEPPPAAGIIATIIVGSICGWFGNHWYLNHVRNAVSKARVQYPDESERIINLTRRGGTSVLGAMGAFTIFLVIVLVVFFFLALMTGKQ